MHAQWKNKNGKQKIAALAVASEPEIFWKGDEARGKEIVSSINIPEELGTLELSRLNGPSGKALDNLYLLPLGLDRVNTWLCDLLPEARINPSQKEAIDREYNTIAKEYNLPTVTVPEFKKSELDSETRRNEILTELEASQAEILILLGDLPIEKFLRFYVDKPFSKLSDFSTGESIYGRAHDLKVNRKHYNVIPLCHPRQVARLGISRSEWGKVHDTWVKGLGGN